MHFSRGRNDILSEQKKVFRDYLIISGDEWINI